MEDQELKELYDTINKWAAFARRHQSNFFDVMFKDVDRFLDDKTFLDAVDDSAAFFGLESPAMDAHCDTLAKIRSLEKSAGLFELNYNLQLLVKSGINNADAVALCVAHEMAHCYFSEVSFNFCMNESWSHEIAADYMVGLYSLRRNLATGKYKYVIGETHATMSHPNGIHRVEALEFARDYVSKYGYYDLGSAQCGIPAFFLGRQNMLNIEYLRYACEPLRQKVSK